MPSSAQVKQYSHLGQSHEGAVMTFGHASSKVMKVLDATSGLMACRVCGTTHFANIRPNCGRYYRSNWQCQHGCKLPQYIERPSTGRRAKGTR